MKKITLILSLVLYLFCGYSQLPQNGLVLYYPFNGNTNDQSGNNNHGINCGATHTTDRFGIPNASLSFDGINDFVKVPVNLLNTASASTISVWVKVSNLGQYNPVIVVGDSTAIEGLNGKSYNLIVYPTGLDEQRTKKIIFQYDNRMCQSGFLAWFSDTSYNFNTTEWVHLVITSNGSITKYYKNGIEVSSLYQGSTIPVSGNLISQLCSGVNYFWLGKSKRTTEVWHFNGKIDDVAIWNRVLSSEEILNLYNYNQTLNINGDTNICENNIETYSVQSVNNAISYIWSIPSGWSMISGQGSNSITVQASSLSGNISVTPVFSSGNGNPTSIHINVNSSPYNTTIIPTLGLVGWWPFNGNANDESINNNHGVVNGATLTNDRFNNPNSAYSFDGINDYISIDSLTITNNFTISFWIKSQMGDNNYGVILNDGSVNYSGNDFLINIDSNRIGIRADKNGFPLNYEYNSPLALSNLSIYNQWANVIWVMKPDSSKIYLNGIKLIDIYVQGSNENYHDSSAYIGVRKVWSYFDKFFLGKIDDIGIWNRPLNNQEIFEVYNSSAINSIIGDSIICNGSIETYSVNPINNTDIYNWTVPIGWIINSGQGTNIISVTTGNSSGNITVTPSNSCGNGLSISLNVSALTTPSQASIISGNINPCQGNSGLVYSVNNVVGVSYTWTVPNGWIINSGQGSNSISVTVGNYNGNISVIPSNTCGNGPSRSLGVSTIAIPSQPSIINGNINPCQGNSGIIYSVTNVADVSYNWTLPNGWSIISGQGTNIISVLTGTSSGNITVTPSNTCGNGASRSTSVSTLTTPSQPSIISGNINPCQGSSGLVYSVNNVDGVTYTWTVPSGWSITSGQGTNSITINVGISSGSIAVAPSNTCGNGLSRSISVSTITIPTQPSIISGNFNPCQGNSGLVYSVNNVAGVSYTWIVPNGWIINSGQGTNSISVTVGNSNGNIFVTPSNTCGNGSSRSVYVSTITIPSQPSIISGDINPCQGSSGIVYSVTNVNGVTYTWTVPNGWSINSGQGTNSISVTIGNSNGNISVTPSNTCGNGLLRSLSVSTITIPSQPSIISGNLNPCQETNGLTYSVLEENGVSYNWIVPNDWIIVNGQGSHLVTVNSGLNGGSINVIPSNICGIGSAININITTMNLPNNPSNITGNTIVCQGTNNIYTIIPIENATSYLWTFPAGITGNSNSYNISLDFSNLAFSGYISANGMNPCGIGIPAYLYVNVIEMPNTPEIILLDSILHSNYETGNQWYNQNGLIQGATNQDYAFTANGSYYVIVTINDCNSEPSNTISIGNVSILNFDENENCFIYPNPFSNSLNIDSKINTPIDIELVNSIGQLIYKENNIIQTTIQTQSIAPGLYFVKIKNSQGFDKIYKVIKN